MLLRLIVASLVLCATAFAEAPTVIVTKAGYYVVNVDSAGVPSLARANVVDYRDGTTPLPPPPDETPPDPSSVRARVKEIATSVGDPVGAQALTIVYRETGKAIKDKNVARDQVLQALRQSSDSVLTASGSLAKWVTARQKIGTIITEEEAKGNVDYSRLCDEIAKGLEDGAGPAPALDPVLLQLIVQLVMQILQFIFGIGGGGVGGV